MLRRGARDNDIYIVEITDLDLGLTKRESLSSAALITVETSHNICKGIEMSDAKRPISLIWERGRL